MFVFLSLSHVVSWVRCGTISIPDLCHLSYFYQKIRNDLADRWMGLKGLQNKQKIKYNVSFISYSLFTTHLNSPKLIVRNTYILKTITRIIWKVSVNSIYFSLLFSSLGNFSGCSEWIQATLSTIPVAEWRA